MATVDNDVPPPPPPPPGFMTIRQILDLPNESLGGRELYQVIGFVKDVQEPVATRGSDYKMSIEIVDHSLFDSHGVKINIFWPAERMPKLSGVGDALVIRKIKVQMYSGVVSLIAHFSTEFHTLRSFKIPSSLPSKSPLAWVSFPRNSRLPNDVETNYVIWQNNHRADLELPSDTEFETRRKRSTNLKDKFSLLQDIEPDCFYNILGEVIRVHDGPGSVTLYFSDYTANPKFYNQIWGAAGEEIVAHDDYGYVKSRYKPKEGQNWPGPFGKMSIQLTLWDGHASFVRDNVKENDWVILSNVRIKTANMGFLEGSLRGDREAFDGKHQVVVLERTDDTSTMDPRWKEAITRKLQYEKKFQKQKHAILDNDSEGSMKRKRKDDEPAPLNGKKRRAQKRLAAQKKESLNLNENVNCAFGDQEVVPLSVILKPCKLSAEDPECAAPFTLAKYRANVRVVDYFPHKVEDFAFGYRASVYDALSDYSGGEDTDLEEDLRTFRDGKGFKKNKWVWRFALQVEEAGVKSSKDRIWLMVDNQAAQGLLGLEEDATNLRQDSDLFTKLKDQLFKLWGDLEEQKSALLPLSAPPPAQAPRPSSSLETDADMPSSPPQRGIAMPDPDSDAENAPTLRHKPQPNPSSLPLPLPEAIASKPNTEITAIEPKNKAFTCCIKQYGVKLDESDPLKANAGNGKRWQRMFALFGTQISGY